MIKMPGQAAKSKFTITDSVANQKIAFEGDPVGPMRRCGSFVFEPASGGTKVTALPTPEPRDLFQLIPPMLAGYIEQQNQAHLGT